MTEEKFHHFLALTNGSYGLEREGYPASKQSGAHGRGGAVDDIYERSGIGIGRMRQEFEIAERELVEPHVFVFFNAAERCDMSRLQMLGHIEIMEYASGCYYAQWQFLYTKPFQTRGGELLAESVVSRLLGEHPVFEFEGEIFIAIEALKIRFGLAQEEHLFRLEIMQEFFDIRLRTLCNEELTR